MEGTLEMRWEKGDEEPMAVVTDLALQHPKTAWYRQYKDGKRGWFPGEQIRMLKLERASRMWLV